MRTAPTLTEGGGLIVKAKGKDDSDTHIQFVSCIENI